MNLRDIARRADVLDGQLTLWLMPYLTLRNDLAQAALEKAIPREDWQDIHHIFLIVEGSAVDVVAKNDADAEVAAFATYFRERGTNVAANFDLFTQVVGGKVYGAIIDAYLQTRDTSIEDAEFAERAGDSPEA